MKVLLPLYGEVSLASRSVNRFRSQTFLEQPCEVLNASFWIYSSFYQAQTKLNMTNDWFFLVFFFFPANMKVINKSKLMLH